MAHLEVEPRPKRPNWLWALLIIIAVLLLFTLFKYCTSEPGEMLGKQPLLPPLS